MPKDDYKFFKIILGAIIVTDVLVWGIILFPAESPPAGGLEMYFLDVGQGDSSLVILPSPMGGVKILIDGGPINGKLEKNLEKILAANDRYVDLVVISHPQLDHFGGLIEVLKNYKVGAVITSGQTSQSFAWQELEKIIKEKGIQRIILAAGDKIKYRNSQFNVLSPDGNGWLKDANDLSLVVFLKHSNILENVGMSALFTGDIGAEAEKRLADLYDIGADILKVSHHGSKYSSAPEFLKEVSPAVSVIEVGKNSYGHPTKEALSRLADAGSQIFRTDLDGLVKLVIDNGNIKIYSQH